MAEGGEEKTFDPTPRKLRQAREQGDIPVSREGGAAGLMGAMLLATVLAGGFACRRIGELMLPLLDQPDGFAELTGEGFRQAALAACGAVALAVAPVFGILVAGVLLPHVAQNSILFSGTRLMPKLSNLSPGRAVGRVFGRRALFEFAKSMVKMAVVGIGCFFVARPLYRDSPKLVSLDPRALPPILEGAAVSLLGMVTLVAFAVAAIDVPYQRWVYRRRHRMTLTEIKDEMKEADGNPHIKGKIRQLRRERAGKRMMQDVKKASVVITNPTHYAVALRYERGMDAAPVVVAKGLDLVARNIRRIANESGVPTMEDRPLARALHASVEIGQVIPREHFEAVAKIIGLIWAQKGRKG